MSKILLLKKSLFLLVTVATFLPVMTLSARGGMGGGMRGGAGYRDMGGGDRYHDNAYHNSYDQHRYTNPYDTGGYGGYGGGGYGSYGGGYGGYVAPMYPDPESQPGMSDDSSALYDSYLRTNPPQH